MQDYPSMPSIPKVEFNKNGFQIRSEILKLAQDFEISNYETQYKIFETKINTKIKNGEVVTEVTFPTFPGVDTILNTAKAYYDFVNRKQ